VFSLFDFSLSVWLIATLAMGYYVLREISARENRNPASMWSLFVPFAIVSFTLGIFSAIFVVGNGASTYQASGSFKLWNLWNKIYYPLLFVNLINAFLVLMNCCSRPPCFEFKGQIGRRVVAIVAAVISLLHVYLFYPSA